MRIKYHRQIVDMLYEEWDLGKTAARAKGKTCAWIYWLGILNEAEEIVVEKVHDTVIGVCGYTKCGSKKHFIKKRFYRLMRWLLINSPLIEDKSAIYRYDDNYDYLPKELENRFDGEVTLLIVDKQYRDRQIGRKLLYETFEMARDAGLRNVKILSDESCNYRFYEEAGCTKVYEGTISNGEPGKCGDVKTAIGFVYEKKL